MSRVQPREELGEHGTDGLGVIHHLVVEAVEERADFVARPGCRPAEVDLHHTRLADHVGHLQEQSAALLEGGIHGETGNELLAVGQERLLLVDDAMTEEAVMA